MGESGTVISVNVSTGKGERKRPVPSATVTPEGLESDAHAGDWHRQVSLLAVESISSMGPALKEKGVKVGPGDFAENITTEGLELPSLPLGTRLRIGADVVLEVTQIGKECHQGCDIRKQVGDCVMPREGIFARVVRTGTVREGDAITIAPAAPAG
jgi:MOSC domain-containing protein YiiM